MEEKRENKALAVSYARALGYNQNQIKCLVTLWTRESRFDHLADNPRSSAYGIAQLLRERSGNLNYKSFTAYDTLVTAMEGVRVALSAIPIDGVGTDETT